MKVITSKSVNKRKVIENADIPTIVDGQVLIKVHNAGINHIDLTQAQNFKKIDEKILGVEISGEIVASKSDKVEVGQRVAALLDQGGYAEYVATSADRIIPIPDNINYRQGASIPESYLTAYQALFNIGNLQSNQSVLIHAGASGVGVAAIQLARAIANAKIITTSSSSKTKICINNGADNAIDYKTQDFAEEVANLTNTQGVNLILDFIGASYFQQNIDSLVIDGKLVLIGNLGGNEVKKVDLLQLMIKRLSITGTLLSSRSDVYKADLIAKFNQNTAEAFKDKSLTPSFNKVFQMEDVKLAYDYIKSGQNIGKVLLEME
ncbi:quinone oxidoreductase [Apilactobacillus ozensis DSM 23829 = JCM 17196]|uniref:Quinone oxidoreductase n=1 Tax=Apilactobacillus ozensis DSM 23829 = JCM 17196 TaxID=1423781 RepID=A0A0R2AWE0_9LACO|nr:NAD(P)H-quinone oxidoreductase [Apilactobacillus ozensis]KRM67555.1 quinone oxidoreductase [Apilactobacillus ozensis DSM 23829 = JCM 17196]